MTSDNPLTASLSLIFGYVVTLNCDDMLNIFTLEFREQPKTIGTITD